MKTECISLMWRYVWHRCRGLKGPAQGMHSWLLDIEVFIQDMFFEVLTFHALLIQDQVGNKSLNLLGMCKLLWTILSLPLLSFPISLATCPTLYSYHSPFQSHLIEMWMIAHVQDLVSLKLRESPSPSTTHRPVDFCQVKKITSTSEPKKNQP